jgi:hypothetical protein
MSSSSSCPIERSTRPRLDLGGLGTLQLEQGVSFAAVPVFDVSRTDPIPGHPHPWQPPQRHAPSGDEAFAWTI